MFMCRSLRTFWDRLKCSFNAVIDDCKEILLQPKITFTKDEIHSYEVLTYLTPPEILRVYRAFVKIRGVEFTETDKNPSVLLERVLSSPELCNNPFKDRIVKVFAYSKPFMCFEEYLNMASVFSAEAPMGVKAEYAFKIYDFKNDDMICKDDVQELLNRLQGTYGLNPRACEEVTEMFISEADVDGDKFVNYTEFEHMLSKNPDFMNSFRMKI